MITIKRRRLTRTRRCPLTRWAGPRPRHFRRPLALNRHRALCRHVLAAVLGLSLVRRGGEFLGTLILLRGTSGGGLIFVLLDHARALGVRNACCLVGPLGRTGVFDLPLLRRRSELLGTLILLRSTPAGGLIFVLLSTARTLGVRNA